jgi:hypothetical protein
MMKRLVTILLILFALSSYGQRYTDARDVRVRRYLVWDNDSGRTAASADSVLGISGDSVVLVPYSATGYWEGSGDDIYNSNTGNVGIGVLSPQTKLHIEDSTGALGVIAHMYTSGSAYPQVNFAKFNGTPSSYAALATNAIIGGFGFSGSHNATENVVGAAIRVRTTQAWTESVRGTEIVFYTTEKDSASADITMRIDSNANVLVPYGDVVTWGGYSTWTPTWVWTGGNIGTPTTVVARYMVINRTVFFHVDAEGANFSGSASTAFNITLPVTVKDVNAYIPCTGLYNASEKAMPITSFAAIIDADVNFKLYGENISIINNDDFKIVISGKYEIRGK